MTLSNLLAIRSHSSLGLCLVDFGDGLTICSNLRRLTIGLHLESLAAAAHNIFVHHSTTHLLHHFIDTSSEAASVKEWIISERVSHPKALKHLACHLVHFLMVPLHHSKHIVVSATERFHSSIIVVALVGLH
jgi:hypothetical protein